MSGCGRVIIVKDRCSAADKVWLVSWQITGKQRVVLLAYVCAAGMQGCLLLQCLLQEHPLLIINGCVLQPATGTEEA